MYLKLAQTYKIKELFSHNETIIDNCAKTPGKFENNLKGKLRRCKILGRLKAKIYWPHRNKESSLVLCLTQNFCTFALEIMMQSGCSIKS